MLAFGSISMGACTAVTGCIQLIGNRQLLKTWIKTLVMIPAFRSSSQLATSHPGERLTDHKPWLPTTPDCFLRLPLELIENIAACLQTHDELRRSCRIRLGLSRILGASIPLFYSQMFWVTRAKSSSDRAFLLDVLKGREFQDWRSLYHLTKGSLLHKALKCRRRIWPLAQALLEKINMEWSGSSSLQPRSNLSGYRWETVRSYFFFA